MEPHYTAVSTPLMMCDAFTTDRFHGNPAAVCFVPSSVYCMEWSAVGSLEASFGRGEPEALESKMSERERDAAAEKYAAGRNIKMGRAFQQVAKEMNLSETAFVYRLPASRIRTIQQTIMRKCNEFENEYEEKVRRESVTHHRNSAAVTEDDEVPGMQTSDRQEGAAAHTTDSTSTPQHMKRRQSDITSPRSPGLMPGTSFSVAYFGASFLDHRASVCLPNAGSIMEGGAPRTRRMHTQWFGLRWFTPTHEMPLCGHATFAAAHSIFEASRLCQSEATRHIVSHIPMEFFVPAQTDVICFVTESGIISVRQKSGARMGTGAAALSSFAYTPDSYEVHFPMAEAISVKNAVPTELCEELATALGLPYGAECIEDIAFSKAMGCYVARLATPQNVLECRPNYTALREAFSTPHFTQALKKHTDVLGAVKSLAVTAANEGQLTMGRASHADVVSRFFAPWIGIDEDPVTGTLYTAITPYWLRIRQDGHFKVGDRLNFYQASARGGSVTGIIIGRRAERVALIGPALTFMRGTCTFEVEDEP